MKRSALLPFVLRSAAAVLPIAPCLVDCAQSGAGYYPTGDEGGVAPPLDAAVDAVDGGDTGSPPRVDSGAPRADSGAPVMDASTGGSPGSAGEAGTIPEAGGTGSGGPTDDAGGDSGSCSPVAVTAPPTSGGPACQGLGDPSCYPHDVTSFSPTWVPPVGHAMGACTAAQIADYYEQCLKNGPNRPPCASWPNANAGCHACLVTDHGASTWGPLVTYGAVALVNTSGCIAMAEPCNQPCAQAIQADLACEAAACDPTSFAVCDVTSQPGFEAYQTCVSNADSTCGCKGYAASAQCEKDIATPSHPAFATCYASTDPTQASFEQLYTSVATYMCGP